MRREKRNILHSGFLGKEFLLNVKQPPRPLPPPPPTLACEQQTYFRSSHLSLQKVVFRKERGADQKYVCCCSQATPLPSKVKWSAPINWRWSQKEQTAFDRLKEKLSNPPVLTHFSVELTFKIDTDVSNCGVDAVISHFYPKGEERPMAFAFRTFKQEREKLSSN